MTETVTKCEICGCPLSFEKNKAEARREGIKEGISRFAWWKDGVQYVGTCGMTLKDALKEV